MKNPVFKNKENECIKLDDREYWISRSVAIVSVLIFHDKLSNDFFVLLGKRSDKMEQPGKFCCPCGYIDWNENGWECAVRETYEETGLYIPDYEEKILFDNDKEPFYINTKPDSSRQNIALSYGTFFNSVLNFNILKNDEMIGIVYVNVKDLNGFDIAFNHEKRIKLFMEIIENKLKKHQFGPININI